MKTSFKGSSVHMLRMAGLLAATAVACSSSDRPDGSGDKTGLLAQALVPVNTTDVTDIQYTIQQVSCDDGSPIGAPIVTTSPLEDQAIPGNIPELQNTPLDDGSSHLFADAFEVVPAGCYDVRTTPLAGQAVSEDCAEAFKKGVQVEQGQTTEVFLINQCKGEDPGAIDVISALNREPVLEDVNFSDSKFVCGGTAEVCIEASDPDNDPIEIVLEAAECDVAPVGEPGGGQQCFEVTCAEFGQAPLVATVYDQLWDNGSLIRIEDWLANEGYPNESHAELDFYAYFDGIQLYPDTDDDGFGDEDAPYELFCDDDDTTGYTDDNTDCNDTDGEINPDAEEVCDDVDNDCDGEVDEDLNCDPIPPDPGTDVVVFNDINPFDNTGMANPNNRLMAANLVDFTSGKVRDAAKTVQMDRGRSSVCGGTGECSPTSIATMTGVMTGLGYAIQDIASNSGTLTSFDPDVKVIFLWNPRVEYTVPEINAFKSFASEGGRVVFVGEYASYYGTGIGVENAFLLNMGAVMTNIGQQIDCGFNTLPGASLRLHQVTTGMTDVTIACASIIVPGPGDFPLFYDQSNTHVLAGVAQIDTTPITSLSVPAPVVVDTSTATSASGE